MVVDSIGNISVGRRAGSLRRKRRLIEMFGVDGAVVFDDERLLAVGELSVRIRTLATSGARATAARLAFLWGSRPIKSQLRRRRDHPLQEPQRCERSAEAVMNFRRPEQAKAQFRRRFDRTILPNRALPVPAYAVLLFSPLPRPRDDPPVEDQHGYRVARQPQPDERKIVPQGGVAVLASREDQLLRLEGRMQTCNRKATCRPPTSG